MSTDFKLICSYVEFLFFFNEFKRAAAHTRSEMKGTGGDFSGASFSLLQTDFIAKNQNPLDLFISTRLELH